jgi:Arc/MetJ family transcription regulator
LKSTPPEVEASVFMNTRKTSVLIDQDLLSAVQGVLETKTIKDTIEKAFVEVLRSRAQREEVEALTRMNGLDLANEEVMERAWRG